MGGAVDGDGLQEGAVREGGQRLAGHLRRGAEEVREVLAPWCLQGADAEEARDEGWQAGDLWKGRHGEGEASQDGGQVLRRRGAQEAFLSRACRRHACICACSPLLVVWVHGRACCTWRRRAPEKRK